MADPFYDASADVYSEDTTASSAYSAFYDAFSEFGLTVVYRMRGYDAALARQVFWNSPGQPDTTGHYYTGAGPLSLIVVQNIITL